MSLLDISSSLNATQLAVLLRFMNRLYQSLQDEDNINTLIANKIYRYTDESDEQYEKRLLLLEKEDESESDEAHHLRILNALLLMIREAPVYHEDISYPHGHQSTYKLANENLFTPKQLEMIHQLRMLSHYAYDHVHLIEDYTPLEGDQPIREGLDEKNRPWCKVRHRSYSQTDYGGIGDQAPFYLNQYNFEGQEVRPTHVQRVLDLYLLYHIAQNRLKMHSLSNTSGKEDVFEHNHYFDEVTEKLKVSTNKSDLKLGIKMPKVFWGDKEKIKRHPTNILPLADPNYIYEDESKSEPLLFPLLRRHAFDEVSFLLLAGCDPNARDSRGQTAMHYVINQLRRYASDSDTLDNFITLGIYLCVAGVDPSMLVKNEFEQTTSFLDAVLHAGANETVAPTAICTKEGEEFSSQELAIMFLPIMGFPFKQSLKEGPLLSAEDLLTEEKLLAEEKLLTEEMLITEEKMLFKWLSVYLTERQVKLLSKRAGNKLLTYALWGEAKDQVYKWSIGSYGHFNRYNDRILCEKEERFAPAGVCRSYQLDYFISLCIPETIEDGQLYYLELLQHWNNGIAYESSRTYKCGDFGEEVRITEELESHKLADGVTTVKQAVQDALAAEHFNGDYEIIHTRIVPDVAMVPYTTLNTEHSITGGIASTMPSVKYVPDPYQGVKEKTGWLIARMFSAKENLTWQSSSFVDREKPIKLHPDDVPHSTNIGCATIGNCQELFKQYADAFIALQRNYSKNIAKGKRKVVLDDEDYKEISKHLTLPDENRSTLLLIEVENVSPRKGQPTKYELLKKHPRRTSSDSQSSQTSTGSSQFSYSSSDEKEVYPSAFKPYQSQKPKWIKNSSKHPLLIKVTVVELYFIPMLLAPPALRYRLGFTDPYWPNSNENFYKGFLRAIAETHNQRLFDSFGFDPRVLDEEEQNDIDSKLALEEICQYIAMVGL